MTTISHWKGRVEQLQNELTQLRTKNSCLTQNMLHWKQLAFTFQQKLKEVLGTRKYDLLSSGYSSLKPTPRLSPCEKSLKMKSPRKSPNSKTSSPRKAKFIFNRDVEKHPEMPSAMPRKMPEGFDGLVLCLDLDETLIQCLRGEYDQEKFCDFECKREKSSPTSKNFRCMIRNGCPKLIECISQLAEKGEIIIVIYTAARKFYARNVVRNIFGSNLKHVTMLWTKSNLGEKPNGQKFKDLDAVARVLDVNIKQILMIDDNQKYFKHEHKESGNVWFVPPMDPKLSTTHPKQDKVLNHVQKSLLYWLKNIRPWNCEKKTWVRGDIEGKKTIRMILEDEKSAETFRNCREEKIEMIRLLSSSISMGKRMQLLFSTLDLLDRFSLTTVQPTTNLHVAAAFHLVIPYICKHTVTSEDICSLMHRCFKVNISIQELQNTCDQFRQVNHYNIYRTNLFLAFRSLLHTLSVSASERQLIQQLGTELLDNCIYTYSFLYASQDPIHYCTCILEVLCNNCSFFQNVQLPKYDYHSEWFKKFKEELSSRFNKSSLIEEDINIWKLL